MFQTILQIRKLESASHLQIVYDCALVTSTSISWVDADIFVMSLFVMGGNEITCCDWSNRHGNKGLPSSRYKYLCIPEYTFRFFSLRRLSASICNFWNRSAPVYILLCIKGFISNSVGSIAVYVRSPE